MVKLPNLDLLMYKAMLYFQQDKEFLEKRDELKSRNHRNVTFDLETFPQTWGKYMYRLRYNRKRRGGNRGLCHD